jgi:transcriptional regulator with XRE-family HTH domain
MTLLETSAVCGVSTGQLSDVERGRTRPVLPLLLRLADAYGMTVAQLLEGVYPFGTAVPPEGTPAPPPDGRRRPGN